MVSSSQMRAARSLLGWSALELAAAASIGSATVKRYEVQEGVPEGSIKTLSAIKRALESAGIEFLGDPEKNPGVMLHIKQED